MISGALAGLGGGLHLLSGAGITMNVSNVLSAEGFTGISVALLGLGNPIGIIFGGILIAYLQMGGFQMQLFGFVPEIIEIVTAVIIYFCAFVLLFRMFFTKLTKKVGRKEAEEAGADPPGGGGNAPPLPDDGEGTVQAHQPEDEQERGGDRL
jgi:simple sugar transport system permease protein